MSQRHRTQSLAPSTAPESQRENLQARRLLDGAGPSSFQRMTARCWSRKARRSSFSPPMNIRLIADHLLRSCARSVWPTRSERQTVEPPRPKEIGRLLSRVYPALIRIGGRHPACHGGAASFVTSRRDLPGVKRAKPNRTIAPRKVYRRIRPS
jgi:hypothetical protein